MSFFPEDELQGSKAQSLAPMIDFLFLMLMFFATLAVSRVTTRDTELDLVEIRPETTTEAEVADNTHKIINISINRAGKYKWETDLRDYPLSSPEAIALELQNQHEQGALPEDPARTQVLLRIDKKTEWKPIVEAVFAIRRAGFNVYPIYIPEEEIASAQ